MVWLWFWRFYLKRNEASNLGAKKICEQSSHESVYPSYFWKFHAWQISYAPALACVLLKLPLIWIFLLTFAMNGGMPGFRFAYMGSTAACDVFPGRHRERCLRTWQGDLKTLCSWMDPVLSFLLPWPYISAHFWLHLVYPFSNWHKHLRYSRIRRKHYHNRNHRSLNNTYPIFLTWNWAGIVAYRGNQRFQYASSSLSVGWLWCPDLPPPKRTTDQHMLGSLTSHQLLHTPSLRSPKNWWSSTSNVHIYVSRNQLIAHKFCVSTLSSSFWSQVKLQRLC